MWKTVKLGDLYNVGSSKRVLKADWKTEGIPFYRGREITALSEHGQVDNELFITDEHYQTLSAKSGVPSPGDIMITAIGTIGNTYIVQPNNKFYFKDASVLWLRRKIDVSSKYVQYWLKTEDFFSQLDKGNGATVDTLTIKKLASVSIPLPPLPEQQRIVAKLDAAFAEINRAIELENDKEAETNALERSLLENLFSMPYPLTKVGDLGEVKSGGTPNSKEASYWDGNIPWYSSGELNNLFASKSQKFITEDGLNNSNAKLFPKGTLLVGMYDTAAMKMSILEEKATFNQAIVGIPPNQFASAEYLFYALKYLKPTILLERRGVRQQNLSLAKIKNIDVPLPNISIQNQIVQRLTEFGVQQASYQCAVIEKRKKFQLLKSAILAQELQPPESKAA